MGLKRQERNINSAIMEGLHEAIQSQPELAVLLSEGPGLSKILEVVRSTSQQVFEKTLVLEDTALLRHLNAELPTAKGLWEASVATTSNKVHLILSGSQTSQEEETQRLYKVFFRLFSSSIPEGTYWNTEDLRATPIGYAFYKNIAQKIRQGASIDLKSAIIELLGEKEAQALWCKKAKARPSNKGAPQRHKSFLENFTKLVKKWKTWNISKLRECSWGRLFCDFASRNGGLEVVIKRLLGEEKGQSLWIKFRSQSTEITEKYTKLLQDFAVSLNEGEVWNIKKLQLFPGGESFYWYAKEKWKREKNSTPSEGLRVAIIDLLGKEAGQALWSRFRPERIQVKEKHIRFLEEFAASLWENELWSITSFLTINGGKAFLKYVRDNTKRKWWIIVNQQLRLIIIDLLWEEKGKILWSKFKPEKEQVRERHIEFLEEFAASLWEDELWHTGNLSATDKWKTFFSYVGDNVKRKWWVTVNQRLRLIIIDLLWEEKGKILWLKFKPKNIQVRERYTKFLEDFAVSLWGNQFWNRNTLEMRPHGQSFVFYIFRNFGSIKEGVIDLLGEKKGQVLWSRFKWKTIQVREKYTRFLEDFAASLNEGEVWSAVTLRSKPQGKNFMGYVIKNYGNIEQGIIDLLGEEAGQSLWLKFKPKNTQVRERYTRFLEDFAVSLWGNQFWNRNTLEKRSQGKNSMGYILRNYNSIQEGIIDLLGEEVWNAMLAKKVEGRLPKKTISSTTPPQKSIKNWVTPSASSQAKKKTLSPDSHNSLQLKKDSSTTVKSTPSTKETKIPQSTKPSSHDISTTTKPNTPTFQSPSKKPSVPTSSKTQQQKEWVIYTPDSEGFNLFLQNLGRNIHPVIEQLLRKSWGSWIFTNMAEEHLKLKLQIRKDERWRVLVAM